LTATENVGIPHSSRTYATIAQLHLSVRTENRLRRLKISRIDQIVKTSPSILMSTEGFGKKCLNELAEVVQSFLSSIDEQQLGDLAEGIELWRPYLPNPAVIPRPRHGLRSEKAAAESSSTVLEVFNPKRNPHAQITIEHLPISARARHVLENTNIKTLHDVAMSSPRDILDIKNCGRGTIKELRNVLRDFVASLPESGQRFYRDQASSWLAYPRSSKSESEIFVTPPGLIGVSLAEAIEDAFEKMGTRASSILVKRTGLPRNQPRKTLDAIGRELGVTRERIRQLEVKGAKTLVRKVTFRRPDAYPAIQKLIRAEGVVTLTEVLNAIANRGTLSNLGEEELVLLLLHANDDLFYRLDAKGRIWGLHGVTPGYTERIHGLARNLLRGIPMPCDQLCVEIAKSLGQLEPHALEIIRKILLTPSRSISAEQTDAGIILRPATQSSPDRRRAFVYGYIRDQGVPVTMTEIFSAMQDAEEELIPDSPTRKAALHSIIGLIDRDDRFAWAGSSTWGLREWGYTSQGSSIADAAVEVLRSSSKPLSIPQIADALSHLYRITKAGIAAALINCEGERVERTETKLWRLL